uniref:DUF4789 domain-containing protein n=1 Tax=Clastoptera arizonana TaxID=38151 RepID=A0A1B6DEE2_9HEMI
MITLIILVILFILKTTSISIETDSVQLPRQSNLKITENECFEKSKVLFQGVCHDLLTSDACYDNTEWLVLDYHSIMKTKPMFLPKCVKRQCSKGKYYWPDNGMCYTKTSSSNLCPKGKELKNNVFGEGICDCILIPPHEHVNRTCYQLFTRGPCKHNYILVNLQNRVQCIPDRCHLETLHSRNKTFIFWEETRKCYSLDSTGPCSEGKVLKIDLLLKLPKCVDIAVPAHLVGVPQTCNTDHQDNCNDNVNINTSEVESYITSILLQADQRRKLKNKHRTEEGLH